MKTPSLTVIKTTTRGIHVACNKFKLPTKPITKTEPKKEKSVRCRFTVQRKIGEADRNELLNDIGKTCIPLGIKFNKVFPHDQFVGFVSFDTTLRTQRYYLIVVLRTHKFEFKTTYNNI